jgi:hypothetical protein
MKLFARSGGHWLFWSGVLYLSLTALVAFSPYSDYTMCVQLVWLVMVALPLMCNPLARWLNMKENNMFDFFKKRDYSNVVKFPEVKTPYIVPDAPEPPKPEAKIFYRIGATDSNRVSFSMGHMEITMTKLGCQNMIDQLEVFMNQLHDEGEE